MHKFMKKDLIVECTCEIGALAVSHRLLRSHRHHEAKRTSWVAPHILCRTDGCKIMKVIHWIRHYSHVRYHQMSEILHIVRLGVLFSLSAEEGKPGNEAIHSSSFKMAQHSVEDLDGCILWQRRL